MPPDVRFWGQNAQNSISAPDPAGGAYGVFTQWSCRRSCPKFENIAPGNWKFNAFLQVRMGYIRYFAHLWSLANPFLNYTAHHSSITVRLVIDTRDSCPWKTRAFSGSPFRLAAYEWATLSTGLGGECYVAVSNGARATDGLPS